MLPGEIKGLELHIDPAIQEICETSNATSDTTRSVLYVSLLISILAFVTVVNTHRFNWTTLRIKQLDNTITQLRKEKKSSISLETQSFLEDSIKKTKETLDMKIKNQLDNYTTVKIPILGDAFDVNNLGVVAGFSFLILLVILRFTLTREINNLRIALHSITDRYPEYANEEKFSEFLKTQKEIQGEKFNFKETLSSINYLRRQHHYNYLSMNEIFNLPPLETSKNSLIHTFLGKLVMKMLYFSFFVYIFIFVNDATTIDLAWEVSHVYTIISTVFSVVFILSIFYLSRKCTSIKNYLFSLYSCFKLNGYKWSKDMYNAMRLTQVFALSNKEAKNKEE